MSTAAAIAKASGPRTPEGKSISSQNAITHGLTAKSPLLPSESPAEFEAFRDAILYFMLFDPGAGAFDLTSAGSQDASGPRRAPTLVTIASPSA